MGTALVMEHANALAQMIVSEKTICFFMPNCFINLLFSKSHPWIRI